MNAEINDNTVALVRIGQADLAPGTVVTEEQRKVIEQMMTAAAFEAVENLGLMTREEYDA